MTLLTVGDKGKAACDTCKAFVTTTYADNSGAVANLLVGVCDSCGSVVYPTASINASGERTIRKTADDCYQSGRCGAITTCSLSQ